MANYSWIWGSWFQHGPALVMYPVLTLISVICGLLIGGERQRREKPAGLRTIALVCLGSAVYTMVSVAFTSTTGDSGRVAAQIVTGIGFLGAGVILHGRRIVSGITTAAVIWVAAAIGMTIGAGYALAGIALSFLVNRVMVMIFLYETRWHPDLHDVQIVLEFESKNGMTRVRLERVLVDNGLAPHGAEWSEPSAETGRLTLRLRIARARMYELLSELVEEPGVLSVLREHCAPIPS